MSTSYYSTHESLLQLKFFVIRRMTGRGNDLPSLFAYAQKDLGAAQSGSKFMLKWSHNNYAASYINVRSTTVA